MIKLFSISCVIITIFCCSSKGNDKNFENNTVIIDSTRKMEVIEKNVCDCIKDFESKIEFTDSYNRNILICGTIETLNDNNYTISEFIMIDCFNNDTIIDYSFDAVSTFQLEIYKDSIVIYSMQLTMSIADMELKSTKLYSNNYFFNNKNQLIKGELNFVLEPEGLSENDLTKIDSFCVELEAKIKKQKVMYPYDEESLYLLLIGGINGHKKSDYLLKNLDTLFELDGAIAETYKEISYDFIIKKLHK